jgi:VanZ family protein
MAQSLGQVKAAPRFATTWLPVMAYVALIFTVSSIPQLQAQIPFTVSDKILHALEYALLGFLFARAWSATPPVARSAAAVTLLAIGCAALVGASDEYYQSFVPGKESSVYDFVADAVGACLGQVAFRLLAR